MLQYFTLNMYIYKEIKKYLPKLINISLFLNIINLKMLVLLYLALIIVTINNIRFFLFFLLKK